MFWLITALANPYRSGPLLSDDQAQVDTDPFTWEVPAVTGEHKLVIVLRVPKGHAVYQDQIGLRAIQGEIGDPVFPEAELAPDPSEPEAWRAIHRADVRIEIPVKPGRIELELSHQGCRKGLCWPRKTVTKTVVVH